jgi:hypothetical protein
LGSRGDSSQQAKAFRIVFGPVRRLNDLFESAHWQGVTAVMVMDDDPPAI